MSAELQHCAACDEEYVAGVAACVECGGPLQPGPLERLERGDRGRRSAPPPVDTASPDHMLAELPGQQADHVVRMLVLEGISCKVRCQGIEKRYAAGQQPAEPFAISLPVTIFVPFAQRDAGEDILAAMQHEDVIGEQWDAEPEEAASDIEPERDVDAYEPLPMVEERTIAEDPVKPEGTTARLIVLIVAIGLVLLFLFTR